MKLKKLSFIFIPLLFMIICGCSSINYKKTITKHEQKELVQFAQGIISKLPYGKLSKSDKKYILTHAPNSKIVYNGYKTGAVTLEWELPDGNRIQYKANGKIMEFQNSFRGISFFEIQVRTGYKIRRQ